MRLLKKTVVTFVFLYLFSVAYAQAQASQATATWNAVTTSVTGQPVTGVGYNIYRGPNSDGSSATKLNSTILSTATYVDSTVAAATTYYYYVTAIYTDGTGESVKSVIVRFNASDRVLPAPGAFTVK